MAITNYHTVNGEFIGETTSAVRTGYLTDGLGSVTATQGSTGNVLATYRYKPYGTLLAKTGVGSDPRFLWVGSLGYRSTSLTAVSHYVRARHYVSMIGSWGTVDPLWPGQAVYMYTACNPSTLVDMLGLAPDHSTSIHLFQPGCNGFKSEWEILDKTKSKVALYIKQLIVGKSTCYDCDTKSKCSEKQIDVRALELVPFRAEKGTGVHFVSDEYTAFLGQRTGGKSWFCTKGTITLDTTYEIQKGIAWPPPKPPWSDLINKQQGGVLVGYQIRPYKGTWSGKYQRKIVYEWDCCVDPIWYKFVATGSAMAPYIKEVPRPKPTKSRSCPDKTGVYHQE
jgi:RHS repeat-associated protein